MLDPIDELIEQVLVDAYGEDEQLASFCQWFEDEGRFPLRAQVVGVEVEVRRVDYDGTDPRRLVAVCRRDGEEHTVSLLDIVPMGPLTVETRQLLGAYRRWSHAEPLPNTPAEPAEPTDWLYPRFGPSGVAVSPPLHLTAHGQWDPAVDYWREPDQPLHPLEAAVLAAGPRGCFEMEQVLPGADPDDWDDDPIIAAADLHRVGDDRAARRLLEAVLAHDDRCIDAWGHLGLIAFDGKGPAAARGFYERGVAVAEASFPEAFNGVLPWGMIDNRPFLRCLHGLALCSWRQRRWDEAESAFVARVWLDPYGCAAELSCLAAVRRRQRWTSG